MTFQIEALSPAPFEALFDLTDAELERRGMRRVWADAETGFPCRVSLEDARTGDELVLVNHAHVPEGTPYQAAHAIYVRRGVSQAKPAVGEVPEVLARRLLSVRAFDADFMMQAADVVEGRDAAPVIEAFLAQEGVTQVHLHNARQGCFTALVRPVG